MKSIHDHPFYKEWPAIKKSIWHEVVATEVNGNKYISAHEMTNRIYQAVLDAQSTPPEQYREQEKEK